MTAKPLGSRFAKGAVDNTGTNPYGNGLWSVTFTPSILSIAADVVEVYHMAVTGPAGSLGQVFINMTLYDIIPNGNLASWDPSQPMILNGGQSLILYWNTATAPAPTSTIWLRQPM